MRRAAIAAAASFVVACSVLTSFDGIAPRGPDQAAVDAASEGSVAAPEAGCARVRWPDPPPVAADVGDVGELTSALTQLSVLEPTAQGTTLGFDLDGLCTCPDRPACAGAKPMEPCDLPDSGIDNVADGLFRAFLSQGGSLDDTGLRMGIQAGQYGVIVRITGYNGGGDDPAVNVAVLNAIGVNGDGGVPRNDGTDQWTIDTESLLDARFPAYFSTKAYVTGGVLVAEIPRLVLRARIPVGPSKYSLLEIVVQTAHLVARLGARSSKGVALEDGRIAGRIPAAAMLAQGMRSGACRDSGLYEAIKPVVCAARDLPGDPAKDGRDVACDSLSAAIGFAAAPAGVAPASGTRVDDLPCPLVSDECP